MRKRKSFALKLVLAATIIGGFFFFSKDANAACFSTDMGYNVCTNDSGAPTVSGTSVTFYYSTESGMSGASYGRVEISPVADFSSGVQALCQLPTIDTGTNNQSGMCNSVSSGTWYWRFSRFYDDSDYVFGVGADSTLGVFTVAGGPGPSQSWLWGGSESPGDGVINGNETSLGWVSMNSTNCDANGDGLSDGVNASCPAMGVPVANYGVSIPLSDGNLSGYAWSENLGWVSFNAGDLTGCPIGACTARRVGNDLKGWARVFSMKTAFEAGNSGGWQGWIKIGTDGTEAPGTPSYGVTINPSTGGMSGSAWSGEAEIAGIKYGLGYIDFSRANISAVPGTDQMLICPSNPIIVVTEYRDLKAYFWSNFVGVADCSSPSPTDVTTLSTWGASDITGTNVATINASGILGRVTGISVGTSNITALYNASNAVTTADIIATPTFTCNMCNSSTGNLCTEVTQATPCANNCSDITTPETCPANSGSWIEVAP